MLELIDKPYEIIIPKIDYMMGHEEGIKNIFYNKRNRLYSSVLSCLIKNDDDDIGFINLVDECIDNILFLDEGILSKYRSNGYGRKAIELLLTNKFKKYIIGETKIDNILANNSASRISKLIYICEDRNYYLFGSERTEEFLNSKEFSNFKKEKMKIKI